MAARICFYLFCLFVCFNLPAQTVPEANHIWLSEVGDGNTKIHLYFYWSKKCPHCLEALPYVELFAEEHEWLQLHSYQLVGEPDNVKRYQVMSRSVSGEAQSVPGFIFCGMMMTGFDAQFTPRSLESKLQNCRNYVTKHGHLKGFLQAQDDDVSVSVPLVGQVGTAVDSLGFITLAIAGIDAFNPCAFFVLMFLLSLMLHTGNRRRMFLVGGIFVFFSGLMYFLFMAAWLNLFAMIGHLQIITFVAGLIAVTVGIINMKDFLYFRQGISLTISDAAKPQLMQRMRNLLRTQSLPTLIAATVSLALFANLYEFLCTAGFPMVYTRILTLSDLPYWQYYAYLVFYNVIYIIPLLVIVLLFAWSMGGHKLQEGEGRRLKLISGAMMLMLGAVLLINPILLQNWRVALALLGGAVLISVSLIYIDKWIATRRTRV